VDVERAINGNAEDFLFVEKVEKGLNENDDNVALTQPFRLRTLVVSPVASATVS
jgi:hypothetical protein